MKRNLFTLLLIAGLSWTADAQVDSTRLLRDMKILSSPEMEGRRPGTEGHRKAKEYIQKRFKEIGLKSFKPDYIETFTVRDTIIGQNLIGYIPGKKSDQYIVISGHYDHIGVRREQLNPGADDNASGATGIIEIAEYFAKNQPEHTLIFASFDAEEMGLRGARAFVENPPVPLEKIVLNINLDMVSRNDQNRLVAAGTYHTPSLIPLLDQVKSDKITLIKGYDVPGTGRDDWTNQSDQGAFHAKKIPFIYFGVEDHPDYHTPRDTFENIQPSYFYHAVSLILDAVKIIDKQFK